MKKAKRIIAAVMSAVMTAALSASLTANAIVSFTTEENLAELLEGNGYPYSKVEDASALEVQEYALNLGCEYYVNELGRVIAVRKGPTEIVVKMQGEADETQLNEAAAELFPDARVLRNLGYTKDGELIKTMVVIRDTEDLSLSLAKELFSKVKDEVIGYYFRGNDYRIGHPQYDWRKGIDGKNRQHFTRYSGANDKKDEIQAVIDENSLPCHIEEINDETLDVVMDTEMTYLEEIAVASKITSATGVKCPWCMNLSNGEQAGSSEIDLYNSVSGDANCDKQMDMSDIVLIMQSLANPDKYQLSAQGCYNADMNGDGITVGDAQAIQNQLLGIN